MAETGTGPPRAFGLPEDPDEHSDHNFPASREPPVGVWELHKAPDLHGRMGKDFLQDVVTQV